MHGARPYVCAEHVADEVGHRLEPTSARARRGSGRQPAQVEPNPELELLRAAAVAPLDGDGRSILLCTAQQPLLGR